MKRQLNAADRRRARSIVHLIMGAVLVGVASAVFVGDVDAQSPRKTPDWWVRTDPDARILYDVVEHASKGNVDAQVAAAAMFAVGRGSPEGRKFDAAHYWIQRAIDKGASTALEIAAMLHAIDNPPDLNKAGAMIKRAMEAEKASENQKEGKLSPSCLASPYCVGYTRLIAAYCRVFVVYPTIARRVGKEANILVEVDFENNAVTIKGTAPAEEFANATKLAFEEALQKIPRPAEFNARNFVAQFPLSFKLEDF